METAHEPLHLPLDKWNLVQWKIIHISTSFTVIIIFFDEALKYCDGAKFWGYVGQTLNHSVYNSTLVCNVTSLKTI
jgi:hypothetical protein